MDFISSSPLEHQGTGCPPTRRRDVMWSSVFISAYVLSLGYLLRIYAPAAYMLTQPPDVPRNQYQTLHKEFAIVTRESHYLLLICHYPI
ncbi:hypothetical protein I7I48_10367 [Histoplasma ohiense]|nr:hypothetical protein I7I48_10367 [Histoplasma ohiense (nom. inval.)]